MWKRLSVIKRPIGERRELGSTSGAEPEAMKRGKRKRERDMRRPRETREEEEKRGGKNGWKEGRINQGGTRREKGQKGGVAALKGVRKGT